jgi:serine/threonine-protein kinase
MGAVWLAEHLSLRSPVAVKLLDERITGDAQSLQRFLGEARAAAALRSPHVVQILDHGVDEGTPYIVMEQLDGETLAERLARSGKLSLAATSHIVTQVSRALARAHDAGIVHRDLKPGNVFLVRNDDEDIAKLLDFGIAKSLHDALSGPVQNLTTPGMLVGTPYYMSPEQAGGASTLDHRTDIWSLGVIAFECLLGRRPFEASALGGLLIKIREEPLPVPSRLGHVPASFDVWFARACARDVSERFDSAKAAAQELRRICDDERRASPAAGDSHAALSPPTLAQPTQNHRRGLLVAVGVSVLLGGTLAALSTTLSTPDAGTVAANHVMPTAAAAMAVPIASALPEQATPVVVPVPMEPSARAPNEPPPSASRQPQKAAARRAAPLPAPAASTLSSAAPRRASESTPAARPTVDLGI